MTRLETDDRDALTGEHFAFAHQRRLPLDNAQQVRDAVARFDEVEAVGDIDRDAAWKRILSAAHRHGVELPQKSWRDRPKRETRGPG